MTINKVILVGNLGNDPQVRQTRTDREMCVFSVATNKVRRAKDGSTHTVTDWHQVVAFGTTARNCLQYLKKGSMVYLEGRIKPRCWEDKDGKKRYSIDIVTSAVQFLQPKNSEHSNSNHMPIVVEESDPEIDEGEILWLEAIS